MKRPLRRFSSYLIVLYSFSNLAIADERTNSLEAEVAQLKKEIQELKFSEKYTLEKQDALTQALNRISVHGFLNAAYSTLSGGGSNSGINLNGTRDALEANSQFVAGIQFDAKIADGLRSSLQMVARGTELSNVEATWGYFAYDVTDDLTVRGGRMRLPLYAFSEYLDVGYAYPWTRPPIEVYIIPTNNYEGFDATYDFKVGNIQSSVNVYAGTSKSSAPRSFLDFTADDVLGVAFNFMWDDLTANIFFSRGHNTFVPWDGGPVDQLVSGLAFADRVAASLGFPIVYAAPTDDVRGIFVSASLIYDNGDWFVASEIASSELGTPFYPSGDSGYLTVGYTFGSWMPYVTAATLYTNNKSDQLRNDRVAAFDDLIANGLLPLGNTVIDPVTGTTAAEAAALFSQISAALPAISITQDSYSIGINYSLMQGLKLKLQATHYTGFDGTNGLFSAPPGTSVGDSQTEYTFMANIVY